jgi:cell division protein FtsI/penicillin-binding protein 2
MYEPRVSRVVVALAAAMACLFVRAAWLQVVRRDAILDVQDARIHRRFVLSPRRGDILWKDGTAAATDEAGFVAEIDFAAYEASRWRCAACGAVVRPRNEPSSCPVCREEAIERMPAPDLRALAGVLGIDAATLEHGFERAFAARAKAPRIGRYPLVQHVNRDTAIALSLEAKRFPGVCVRAVRDRVTEPAALTFVGRTRPAYQEDRAFYTDPDREDRGLRVYTNAEVYAMRFGASGLEKALDERLRGDPGCANRVRTKEGLLGEPQVLVPVIDGENVVTTLRRGVQALAQEVVDQAPGEAAAVVLDLADGGIAAIASKSHDRLHHAVCGIRPGSVFKLCTALAILEAGISPQETVRCEGSGRLPSGRRYTCDAVHGDLALEDAFAHSCNAYFETMAERIGSPALRQACCDLGLDEPRPRFLPGTRGGVQATFGSARALPSDELRFLAIGQGRALASPLQIAVAYGCVATGGHLMRPHLADDPAQETRELRPAVAEFAPLLRDAARRVVTTGTGSSVRELVDVSAAGKSGTADTSATVSANNAWFVAYAPAEQPRYVAVVVYEKVPGHGAATVGPHVGRLLAEALR